MTVIAWDGKTLAADKRTTLVGLSRTGTKIRRARGHLIAASGNSSSGKAMMAWFEAGAITSDFPSFKSDDEQADLLVITPCKKIFFYGHIATPSEYEDLHFSIGSGRDYALATMFLGYGARRAVEVACAFEVSCGNGIDTLEFLE